MPTGGHQRPRFGEVPLRLRPHGGHPAARVPEVFGEPADGVEQQSGLRDGVLRRADVAHGVPGPVRTEGVQRLVYLPLGGSQAGLRLGHVVADRGERRLREALAELGEPPLLLRDARSQCHDARRQRLEHGRGGALQVPQAGERLGLLVEPGVGSLGEPKDLTEHLAGGGLVLGDVVVELLAQGEGPRQLVPRGRQGLVEPGHRLVAVLGAGVVEVELRGLHRLVQLEQCVARAALQLLGGCSGVGIGPLEPLHGRGQRLPLPSAGPRHQVGPAAGDGDGAEDEQRPAPAPGIPGGRGTRGIPGAQDVGERHGACSPITLAEFGLHGLSGERIRLLGRELRAGRQGERVAAVLDRDGEDRVVAAEPREVAGLGHPLPGVQALEGVHEDDVEVGAVLGLQLVERAFDLRLVPEHARLVDHLVAEPERFLGQRGAAAPEQESGRTKDDGGPAHGTSWTFSGTDVRPYRRARRPAASHGVGAKPPSRPPEEPA